MVDPGDVATRARLWALVAPDVAERSSGGEPASRSGEECRAPERVGPGDGIPIEGETRPEVDPQVDADVGTGARWVPGAASRDRSPGDARSISPDGPETEPGSVPGGGLLPAGAPPSARVSPPAGGLTPSGARVVDRDTVDVSARVTAAMGTASAAYTAAYGSPLDREPVAQPPRRWAVPVRLALVAGLAVLLVAGAVALRSLSVSRGDLEPVELPTVGAPSPLAGAAPPATASASASGPAGSAAGVIVHVVGEVGRPGLVDLPAGARVADAIDAAGGATPAADLSALNLARVLVDGEQVVVPPPGAPLGATSGAGAADTGSPEGSGALVDLNAADEPTLDALPGIGPVLAGRIVEWRTEHGRFTDVDELGEVDGIGPTLLSKLRPLVRV